MKQFYTLLLFVFFFSISQAQIVNIPDANFKNRILNTSADLDGDGAFESGVDTNNDGEIQVSEAEAVIGLNPISSNIQSLEGIQSFTNLKVLHCNSNNVLSSLDLTQNIHLEELWCYNNALTSLDLSHNINLKVVDCRSNSLSILNISNCPNLMSLRASYNEFTSLDVSNNPSLESFDCYDNQIVELDLSQNLNLISLTCGLNKLTNLDLSNNWNLESLFNQKNYYMTNLNLKNGSSCNTLNLDDNNYLQYICADMDELAQVQQQIDLFGYTNCVLNSYCSFYPGGRYYEIQGVTIVDSDDNGCDNQDPIYPYMKFEITDGNVLETVISNSLGQYYIPVSTATSSTHVITPKLEEDYYIATPNSLVVDFPSDTSPYTQDFCLKPNGVYNDLEISILPLNQARPGFDAEYLLVYKNKGSVNMSDTLTLEYNNNLMSLVSSSPSVYSENEGVLTWNYTNLEPFETRTISFTMNINTPTDPTNPVNGGDVLNYVATVNPVAGDETPADNLSSLKQTVVNSYDPNDKTCLEGTTIEPSMVGEYLHYLIRFENTGSASAVNIVVKDIIDTAKYDINSLRPIDGSHSFVTRIRDTNIVEFIFENINLPFDDANNDGYVAFKIKSLPSLVVGDSLDNNAEIYFDYNAPIITNVAQTTVAVLGIGDYTLDESLQIFPNPIVDNLTIKGNNNLRSVTVYDINGRLLQEVSFIGNQVERAVSLSELETGMYFVKVVSSKGQLVKQIVRE